MFVIGTGGRNIAAEDWQQHVFGYTDLQRRQRTRRSICYVAVDDGQRRFDTFAPMGPYIVSADEIADPHALDHQLAHRGEMLQHSNTRELIFEIPESGRVIFRAS